MSANVDEPEIAIGKGAQKVLSPSALEALPDAMAGEKATWQVNHCLDKSKGIVTFAVHNGQQKVLMLLDLDNVRALVEALSVPLNENAS